MDLGPLVPGLRICLMWASLRGRVRGILRIWGHNFMWIWSLQIRVHLDLEDQVLIVRWFHRRPR